MDIKRTHSVGKKTENGHEPGASAPRIQLIQRRQWKLWQVIAAIVTAVIALVALWFLPTLLDKQRIDNDGYQVIYLVNGQAYFGKLQNTRGDYLVLHSPYTTQPLQSAQDKKDDEVAEQAASQTALIKVRDQVVGPDDSIAVRASQVIYWQNLRDDSKVVQAIKSKQ